MRLLKERAAHPARLLFHLGQQLLGLGHRMRLAVPGRQQFAQERGPLAQVRQALADQGPQGTAEHDHFSHFDRMANVLGEFLGQGHGAVVDEQQQAVARQAPRRRRP